MKEKPFEWLAPLEQICMYCGTKHWEGERNVCPTCNQTGAVTIDAPDRERIKRKVKK